MGNAGCRCNLIWGALLAALLVLAVLAGAVWTALARTGQATAFRTETIAQALEGARRAEVEVKFDVGSLVIGAQPEATDALVEGVLMLAPGETVAPKFRRADDTAYYALKSRSVWGGSVLQGGATWPAEKVWRLELSRDVPLTLRLEPGVGRSDLDLADLTIAGLELKGSVGQIHLTLPRRGSSQITLEGGIGELVVRVPEGTAARVRADEGLGNVVTEGRFVNTGRIYTTATYGAAQEHVEVHVKGGIGRLTRREVAD